MGIKSRLTVLNFLQFFIWGSYLTSLGGYLYATLQFQGAEIGKIFLTLGIASIFTPALLGIIADRWLNAEKLLGLCHLVGAGMLFYASTVTTSNGMFLAMLGVCIAYMPTISLNNTVSYYILNTKGYDPQQHFPPIRVWGTVGFIAAMWVTDLMGWTLTSTQLVFASANAIITGLYCFSLPACKPLQQGGKSLVSAMGLDAFVLLKQPRMALFFFFSMLLGAALQVTNTWGVPFIDHFKTNPIYTDSWGVRHSNMLISISQISETLFILAIPFFLRRYGIKKVMLLSMIAWFLRFGLFGVGNPGTGVIFLILSMIVYGMAFDFFNISGSLFIEKETSAKIRGSAQGLFMMVTNGVGAMMGSYGSGWLVQSYTQGGQTDWQSVWFLLAGYALIIGVFFAIAFKYKHVPEK